jgi:hypothetical protein
MEVLEIEESIELAERLRLQVSAYWGTLDMFVVLPGAGIIDTCEADGISQRTLIEVKAGDRLCRSRDIRQVLTYAGLEMLAGKRQGIDTLCILNPRVGWSLTTEIESVLEMAGGKAFDDFVSEFENYITDSPEMTATDLSAQSGSINAVRTGT